MEPTGLRPRPLPPAGAPKVPPLSLDDLMAPHRSLAATPIGQGELLFLSDAPGTLQIFRQRVGAPAAQLTSFTDRVHGLRAAPDGKRAVFLKDAGGDENDQIFALDLTPGSKPIALTRAPRSKFTTPVFRPDGALVAFTSNARDGKDFDLYFAPLDAVGSASPALELKGQWEPLDWQGDTILLRDAHSGSDADLAVVDATTRKLVRLTPHTGDAKYVDAALVERGAAVVYATDDGRDVVGRVVRVDLKTQAATVIADEPHDVTHLVTSEQSLAYTINDDGIDTLVVLGPSKARREARRFGVCTDLAYAPSGDALYAGVQRADSPGEIVRVDPQTLAIVRVTEGARAGLDPARLVNPELLRVKSFDGLEVPTFWYARAEPGARRPVLVILHGGPESQSRPTWSPQIQYLVSRGYAVAEPNVRGSSGYGKVYAHLDDKEKREDAVRDVEAVRAMLAERPDVDAARMAVEGQSYGGYLALASLALYPDRWAAGIDMFGIADFRAYFEKTAPYWRGQRANEYGSPEKDGDLLDRLSPIHKLDRVRAPLLLLHGARDTRVPLDIGLSVLTALERRGARAEMRVFPDEGHGFAKKENRRTAYLQIGDFLDRVFERPRDPEIAGEDPATTR